MWVFQCLSFGAVRSRPAKPQLHVKVQASFARQPDRDHMRRHVDINVGNELEGLNGVRCAVRQFLEESELGVSSSATLLMSELLTNAFVHGEPPVSATIDYLPSEVRIAVSDGGHDSPFVRSGSDEMGGYGLRIVDALCARWGCDYSKSGKTVWCEVSIPDPVAC